MSHKRLTQEMYERDQADPARISGTNRGKAGVAEFVAGLEERFSGGPDVLCRDDWRAGGERRMATAFEMFIKWLLQTPPFGDRTDTMPVVTFACLRTGGVTMLSNVLTGTPEGRRESEVVFKMIRHVCGEMIAEVTKADKR